MTDINYLTQTQRAERWRSADIGSIYMKMMGRVRYCLSDATDFQEDALRGSTSQRASACNDRR